MLEEVGESPLNDTRFQPGVSGNPGGRPKGSKNKPRSRMRTSLEKLYTINDDAIDILRQHMTGKDVNGKEVKPPSKEKVDTALKVIKAIESYNNTCLKEELAILGVREKDTQGANDLEDNQADTTTPPGFSMDLEDTKH